jgi:threonine synthase
VHRVHRYSYLEALSCPKCDRVHDAGVPQNLCDCGSPLLARYDLEAAAEQVSPAALGARPPDLRRYHELLPVGAPENVVSLGERMTPLLPLPRVGTAIGVPGLLMKDESSLPTGTFKARGAAIGVSRARELGLEGVVMPTNGNAGAAWAAYAARAGLRALVFMPAAAPRVARDECVSLGASLLRVDGLIDDAGAMAGRLAKQSEWFDASTLKEPYRIEGKKTMGLELADQLGWELPDVIIYPAGGGVGLIGIHKGLTELRQLGLVEGRLPRMVAVQAAGCAPIVRAWEQRATESERWSDASTVAFGINVPKALGDFLVLRAIYETDGCALAVSDDELLEDVRLVARTEGHLVCPEGAATVTAARKLAEAGWIAPGERVVVINTGSGSKYPDAIASDAPVVSEDDVFGPDGLRPLVALR